MLMCDEQSFIQSSSRRHVTTLGCTDGYYLKGSGRISTLAASVHTQHGLIVQTVIVASACRRPPSPSPPRSSIKRSADGRTAATSVECTRIGVWARSWRGGARLIRTRHDLKKSNNKEGGNNDEGAVLYNADVMKQMDTSHAAVADTWPMRHIGIDCATTNKAKEGQNENIKACNQRSHLRDDRRRNIYPPCRA
jgi:hypothetical protein